MKAEEMRQEVLKLIQTRKDNLTQPEDEWLADPGGGAHQFIPKGAWLGSGFELQLYNGLISEIKAIPLKRKTRRRGPSQS